MSELDDYPCEKQLNKNFTYLYKSLKVFRYISLCIIFKKLWKTKFGGKIYTWQPLEKDVPEFLGLGKAEWWSIFL